MNAGLKEKMSSEFCLSEWNGRVGDGSYSGHKSRGWLEACDDLSAWHQIYPRHFLVAVYKLLGSLAYSPFTLLSSAA